MLLYTIKLRQKAIVEKFSFSELKIEKRKFFTQRNQIFYISVFNIGGFWASCLTFRPFLTLVPYQLGCLQKQKTCNTISLHFRLFSGKTNYKFFKKSKKLYFRAILGPFCPNLGKNEVSWKNGL